MAELEVGRTHIEIQETETDPRIRVGKMKGWSDTSAASKSEISIIGNLDPNTGKNIKRFRAGSVENSLTLPGYFDPANEAQKKLVAGYSFYKAFVVEDEIDRVVYTNCEVLTRNKTGTEIDGLVGIDITVTVNGSVDDDPVDDATANPAVTEDNV